MTTAADSPPRDSSDPPEPLGATTLETERAPSAPPAALKDRLLARAKPYALPLALSSVMGAIAVHHILERAGRPALPLDDSYIHLQYARRIAEGHPFTFANVIGGFSSGATSFLWPMMLAPFYLLGLHGLNLIYASWLLGTVFHAATVLEAKRLAEPLVGRAAAIGVAAMCYLCGAFVWFAWSGMETIPFAWALVRACRVSADYLDAGDKRTMAGARAVMIAGVVAPLLRPEGACVSLVCAGALFWAGVPAFADRPAPQRTILQRAFGLVPIAGMLFVPTLNLIATGHARGTTAIVKWYVGNPHYEGALLWQAIGNNVRMYVDELLGAGPFTAEFIPDYTQYILRAGLLCLFVAVARRTTRARALVVLAFVAASFIPCTFSTILWNRVRYIYPFAPAWFLLVAALAREIGALVGRVYEASRGSEASAAPSPVDVRFVPAVITGIYAGALAAKLSGAVGDLGTSARAIDKQQVTLGEWANTHLPADAKIGVNDTGAIAYLSNRATFDVVGLTTEGEAKYWVQGAGSRYEHYERMKREELPTHFIVYPGWMAMNPVLGKELTSATVEDQSILGGVTKVAYEASWDTLGRGAVPIDVPAGPRLLDEVDVADLESEAAHKYWFGAAENDNHVYTHYDEEGDLVVDGGRKNRYYDGFVVRLEPGRAARLVLRLGAEHPVDVGVQINDADVGTVSIPVATWIEQELTIPAEVVKAESVVRIQVADLSKRFWSMHYWFYEAP
ncbi:MAG: hypothetical protein U0414_37075 [Polyangiaceae bacterium]